MPEVTHLANGVRILSETMAHMRSVSIGIWVKSGSRQDPAKQLGMAHFAEHMLFKGTAKRDALQIAKDIDALGGVLNAQTAKEYTVYYVKVLDESVAKAADVLELAHRPGRTGKGKTGRAAGNRHDRGHPR